jgi:immune inhibitor A
LQTRTAIWIAIIAILIVCVGLVYTAGVLLVVTDLSRDQQAGVPFTPWPATDLTANPMPTTVPAIVQTPVATNTPTPRPIIVQPSTPTDTPISTPAIVQTPVLSEAEGPVLSKVEGAVSLPEPSTEELLAEAVLPERDLLALTTRLKKSAESIPVVVNATPPRYEVGDRAEFWIHEEPTNAYSRSWATLRYITPHLYMWVEDGYDVDLDDLIDSAERFENETYPNNRRFFGSEWTPGVDNDPHVSIFNGNVPGVGGYYSSADEYSHLVNPYSNEREMFYINLDNASPGSRYYDGILAHEFQHMIHWQTDRNEDTWVNEGCSELAAYLNDYDVGAADRIFSRAPDTQLTAWADDPNLAGPNYGGSYLFMVYFLERFGDEVLRQVVASKADGIAGFDEVLADQGLGVTFEDVFADWLMANYLDDPVLGDGRYGYRDLKIERPAIDVTYSQYPVHSAATVHQYGADYIELQAGGGDVMVHFAGSTEVKLVDNEAHSGSYQWWSNRSDESDTTLTRAFDLTRLEQATLRAWLWYDIEEDYDYVYVEVSTDGGQTWDILPGKYTTDHNPSGNSFGHAYTGKSGVEAGASEAPDATPQWVLEEMDLTAYAGQQVLLRFEYITDDAYNSPGFCVDDISIPELGYHYDAESEDDWVALGFIRTDNTLSQRYLVQLIELGTETRVRRMDLDEAQKGQWVIEGLGGEVERAVLVVSALAPKTTELAGYQYSVKPQ